MTKYIIKRLLLAILMLFCVSVILYTLVRVMPVNFIENKYYSTHTNVAVDSDELKEAMLDVNVEDIEKAQQQGYSDLWNKVFRDGYRGFDDEDVVDELRQQLYSDWEANAGNLSSYSDYAFDEDWQSFYLVKGYIKAFTTYDKAGNLVYVTDENGKYVTELHLKSGNDYIVDADHKSEYALVIYDACKDTEKIAQYMKDYDCDKDYAIELIKRDTAIDVILYRDNVKTYSKGAVAIQSVLAGYAKWIGGVFKGDLGTSFKYNMPVSEKIAQNMGVSFVVSLISLILQLIIAVPLGIQSAYRQYGKLDYITTILTMIGISFPSFFFGSLMIKWFAVDLEWFPVGGFDSTNIFTELYSLVLPIAVLTILSVGSLMRYTRTNTLEVLNADYIRTARAKGASESSVVYKHVFRNTLIPLVTTLAGILPGLFGGAMITEQIFDLPGIGNVAYQALIAGDIPFIMGYNMFLAVLTILGVLLSDVMYAVVDPRVKLGG